MSHGPEHHSWRGNDVGYQTRHRRIYTYRGEPGSCVNGCEATQREWAHIHGTDPFDINNYQSMCLSCHRKYDYRGGKKGLWDGSKHPKSKLTDAIVLECRRRNADGNGEPLAALAREFGVTEPTMHKAVRGITWVHLN